MIYKLQQLDSLSFWSAKQPHLIEFQCLPPIIHHGLLKNIRLKPNLL